MRIIIFRSDDDDIFAEYHQVQYIPRLGDKVSFSDGGYYEVTQVEWALDDDTVFLTIEVSL